MSEQSRFFLLRGGDVRRSVNDRNTLLRPGGEEAIHHPLDARRFFRVSYRYIRPALERRRSLGLSVLVFDEQGAPAAEAWLAASLDQVRSVVVGRHSACPIMVPEKHHEISLRHLLITVRATSHDSLSLRIIDLHTGIGFADEEGHLLKAARVEGSAFLSIGSLRLALLVTGEPPRVDPGEAYACIPERVYFDEEQGPFVPNPRQRAHRAGGEAKECTKVVSMQGPIFASSKLLQDGERSLGRMTLFGRGLQVHKEVGASALERGVVIGRYSRCDVRTGEDSDRVSRVHMIFLAEGDRVMVHDGGSTNGTWVNGEEVSARVLRDGDIVSLSNKDGLGFLWEPTET